MSTSAKLFNTIMLTTPCQVCDCSSAALVIAIQQVYAYTNELQYKKTQNGTVPALDIISIRNLRWISNGSPSVKEVLEKFSDWQMCT